jgi:hypothetical protein
MFSIFYVVMEDLVYCRYNKEINLKCQANLNDIGGRLEYACLLAKLRCGLNDEIALKIFLRKYLQFCNLSLIFKRDFK